MSSVSRGNPTKSISQRPPSIWLCSPAKGIVVGRTDTLFQHRLQSSWACSQMSLVCQPSSVACEGVLGHGFPRLNSVRIVMLLSREDWRIAVEFLRFVHGWLIAFEGWNSKSSSFVLRAVSSNCVSKNWGCVSRHVRELKLLPDKDSKDDAVLVTAACVCSSSIWARIQSTTESLWEEQHDNFTVLSGRKHWRLTKFRFNCD